MTDILTVTVNPVIDIHYYTEEFVIGRDNIVFCREFFAAGKGMREYPKVCVNLQTDVR